MTQSVVKRLSLPRPNAAVKKSLSAYNNGTTKPVICMVTCHKASVIVSFQIYAVANLTSW